ncbi:MAG: MaoC family dehydratase [Burkholderiales bacterium]|nr:MAG: MaoC family dehydratase [Burkholderiales bacterium]
MPTIERIADVEHLVGQEVFVSDWTEVTQARIDKFAEATGDFQWIHVDPQRARRDSPYGATVAHGFLTLSLIGGWNEGAFTIGDSRMGINYGLNRVRFMGPVPAGSRVRGRYRVKSFEPIEGGGQIVMTITIEREGVDKPVCVAESVGRRFR